MLMLGCASSLTYNEAMMRNEKKVKDPKMLADAKFLVEAKSYNLLALAMTEAAVKSGYAASVVSLAKQNREQHQDMAKELQKLARQEKIVLPSEMNEEHQRLLAELQSAERADFDKDFLRLYKTINEEDKENFMRMATDAADDDVRAYAARKLDYFKSHETVFETVDAELMKTY
jgi:predicted outer membrane protein